MILLLNDIGNYIQLSELNSMNHTSVTIGNGVQFMTMLF